MSTRRRRQGTSGGGSGGGGGGVGVTFSAVDPLAVATGTRRVYNDTGKTLTISGVRASLGTAGSTVTTVDVNKGGTTLFTDQTTRPTVAASATTSLTVPQVTTWENGSYLTCDVDAAGTGAAGLTVTVVTA